MTTSTKATMSASAIISQDAIDKAESKNIDESDVGILCYISQVPGFRGILKQRFFIDTNLVLYTLLFLLLFYGLELFLF